MMNEPVKHNPPPGQGGGLPLSFGASSSPNEIAKAALSVMERILTAYSGATQSQWAEDKMTSRLTGETHYVDRAERAFVLQGFAIDLAAIELGRPRLREVFPNRGPGAPNEVPEFAQHLFLDANQGGVFSRAGQIETGVAQRRVRYSDTQLVKALDEIKNDLPEADFDILRRGMDLFVKKDGDGATLG